MEEVTFKIYFLLLEFRIDPEVDVLNLRVC